MLNQIVIMGRLTRDPELRYSQSQRPVCNFTLACERDRTVEDTRPCDFIECVAWNSSAEFVNKYFRKGQLMAVSGRLQQRKWTDKDGNNHSVHEVAVESAYFAERRNE